MKTLVAIVLIISLYQASSNPIPIKKVETSPNLSSTPQISLDKPPETNIKKVESDKQILVKTDPKQGEESLGDKSKDTCNKTLMGYFNLEGLDTPVTKVHQFCPNVTRSCCNGSDEQRTAELWVSEQEGVTEKYYENFLNSVKYLLGYSQEILQLSLQFGEATESQEDLVIQDRLKKHLLKNRVRMLEKTEDSDAEDKVGAKRVVIPRK